MNLSTYLIKYCTFEKGKSRKRRFVIIVLENHLINGSIQAKVLRV